MPHLDTHSLVHQETSSELQLEKRERERERGGGAHSWERTFCICFELSLGIVLAIYNKEVLLGFLPHEGFLG
jgi:hypothetical protein